MAQPSNREQSNNASGAERDRRARNAARFQKRRHAQQRSFPIGRGEQLYANRKGILPGDRHGQHRTVGRRQRLREEAERRAGRLLDTVDAQCRCAERGGNTGRGKKKQHVDVTQQLQHLRAMPTAIRLRAQVSASGNERVGEKPVARVGIELACTSAQILDLLRRAFGRVDQRCGGTSTYRFRVIDDLCHR